MTDNIRRVFLVDYENTSIRGLYGISCLTGNAKVVVFCSTPVIQRAVEDVLQAYKSQGIEIGTFILIKQGKNALDFMISTYLGYEINSKIDKEIYIISGDHGYGSAVEMAKQLDSRMMIGSGRNIFECLPGYMRQGRFDIEDPNDFALPAADDLPKLPGRATDPHTGVAYPVLETARREKRERRSIFSAFRKKKAPEPAPVHAEPAEAIHVDELPPEAKMPARKKSPKVVVEVIDLEDLQVPTRVVGHKVSDTKNASASDPAAKKEKTVVKSAVAKTEQVKPEKTKAEKVKAEKPEKPPKLSRAEKAKLAKAEKEKAEREKERLERERLERERLEKERTERERAEKLRAERLAKEAAGKTKNAAGHVLTKREKQGLRNTIEQYMVQDGIIPEKFHLGVSSAIANAKNETECCDGVKVALGRFYPQYIETILRYYHKFRG
ncbi:MAG: hypothetical protein IK125_03300 [Lachnospiraceae bacterium]|nr:hypothetical protein [Lachnospiraceae bacterium]